MEHMIPVTSTNIDVSKITGDRLYCRTYTWWACTHATIMSNMTGIPMYALDVRSRDTGGNYTGPQNLVDGCEIMQ